MLPHQRDCRAIAERNLHPIRAEHSEQPEVEGDLERTIERILNHQHELNVLSVEVEVEFGEPVLRPHPRSAVRDLGSIVDELQPLGGEERFSEGEQVFVLEDAVAFRDHSENLARVLPHIGVVVRLLPAWEQEAFLLHLEIEVAGDGFDFFSLDVHFLVY